MANTWSVSDSELEVAIGSYQAYLAEREDWHVKLFVNDYSPSPDTVLTDFVEAGYGGYVQSEINRFGWQPVVFAAHVGSTTNDVPCDFLYDSETGSIYTIYGYYVVKDNGYLAWSERFANPVAFAPGDTMSITLIFRHYQAPLPC